MAPTSRSLRTISVDDESSLRDCHRFLCSVFAVSYAEHAFRHTPARLCVTLRGFIRFLLKQTPHYLKLSLTGTTLSRLLMAPSPRCRDPLSSHLSNNNDPQRTPQLPLISLDALVSSSLGASAFRIAGTKGRAFPFPFVESDCKLQAS
jgi:hypothetical protein